MYKVEVWRKVHIDDSVDPDKVKKWFEEGKSGHEVEESLSETEDCLGQYDTETESEVSLDKNMEGDVTIELYGDESRQPIYTNEIKS